MTNSLIENADARLKNALRSYGWYEGRCVSVDEWLMLFGSSRNGRISEVPAMVVSFLQEFGGLEFKCYPSKNAKYGIRWVVFDPWLVAPGTFDTENPWDLLTGKRTFRVGELDGFTVVLTEDGELYYDAAGDGKRIGGTITEALNMLIFREAQPTMAFPGMMQ